MLARLIFIVALAFGAGGCPGADTPLPCDVDRVLEDKCRLCHGEPTAFGAPFELMSWEDTQATVKSQPVWELMQDRVHDPAMPMPPRGLAQLTADELAVLDAWFSAGAPPRADDASCP
ncbi:MAG TPA: hypothetical protein VML75_10460 [Kofleriaceae bacterium]|nr:hypothetical protein [Kofleriaceae bacterium]